jgi:hypothetical protein
VDRLGGEESIIAVTVSEIDVVSGFVGQSWSENVINITRYHTSATINLNERRAALNLNPTNHVRTSCNELPASSVARKRRNQDPHRRLPLQKGPLRVRTPRHLRVGRYELQLLYLRGQGIPRHVRSVDFVAEILMIDDRTQVYSRRQVQVHGWGAGVDPVRVRQQERQP